jgi:MFS family permease
MRAGLRYVRHDPDLRAVLARTGTFVSCASAMWAMLPLVARQQLGLGAFSYGLLLGSLGAGAILAAFILPAIRRKASINTLIIGGTIVFASATAALATVRIFFLLSAMMILGGIAWMALMSSFNISVQAIVPAWVRARVLAIYLLVFFGGMALGSAFWGVVATHIGISNALLCAAGSLIAGLAIGYFFPVRVGEELNLEPSLHWSDPIVVSEPKPEDGPVLITVDYRIDPTRAGEFIEAMREVKRIVRRDGAMRWGLFGDPAQPGHYVETFLVESWVEHMRQHTRHTNEDRVAQDKARSFHLGDSSPVVTHLIAEDFSTRAKRRFGLT